MRTGLTRLIINQYFSNNPEAIINNTHLTFSEDTIVITTEMLEPYRGTITHVTIPEGVTTIGVYAFQGCTGLTHITFPDGLTTIGNYAFHDCTGLQYIIIPRSLENHDVAYWQNKGIDPARTKIITEAQLPQLPQFQAFLETKKNRQPNQYLRDRYPFLSRPRVYSTTTG